MAETVLKKKTRKSFVIFCGVIIMFIIFALITKASTVKSIKNFDSISSIIVEASFSDRHISSQIASCEKSLASSEIIITAKFNGERKSSHYSTLSKITVTDVIKGEDVFIGDEINVYENNAIGAYKGKLFIRNFTPVNFFEKGNEYLLFLNTTDDYDSKYKTYNNIDCQEYTMANYFVSSFCLNKTDSQILKNNKEETTVNYSKYKSSEFIVFSESQKEQLYSLKEEIINRYIA